MKPRELDLSKLRQSLGKDYADPVKLEAHGPFDWNYLPMCSPRVEVSMHELDDGYKMLLNVGFIVLRDAIQSGSSEWIKAEMEMLHNIPSLIGESNSERHKYYWLHERRAYVDWISKYGSEYARSRMKTFYDPTWEAMAKEVQILIDQPVCAT